MEKISKLPIMSMTQIQKFADNIKSYIDGTITIDDTRRKNFECIWHICTVFQANCFAQTLREFSQFISLNTELFSEEELLQGAKVLGLETEKTNDKLQLKIDWSKVVPENKMLPESKLNDIKEGLEQEIKETLNVTETKPVLVKDLDGDVKITESKNKQKGTNPMAKYLPDVNKFTELSDVINGIKQITDVGAHPALILKALDIFREGSYRVFKRKEDDTKAEQYRNMSITKAFDNVIRFGGKRSEAINGFIATCLSKYELFPTIVPLHAYIKSLNSKLSDEDIAALVTHIVNLDCKDKGYINNTSSELFRSEMENMFELENFIRENGEDIPQKRIRYNNKMISDLYPVLKGKGQHKIIDKDKYARQLQSIINLYNPSDNRLSVYVDKADYDEADYSNGEYPNTDDKKPIEKSEEQKDENKSVETTETPQVEQQSTEKEKVAEKAPEQATEASTEVSKDTDKKSTKKSKKKSKK